MRWTLIVDAAGRRGRENMSIDQGLLCAVRDGTGFVRLYRWAPPCLSFGRNEPAKSRYDADEIKRLGLETVRRPTGGRAVWHDEELTYAVAAPLHTFGSLRQTYMAIHELLLKAFERIGLHDAALAPTRRERSPVMGAGACFGSATGGEIVVNGRKLVGSAQLRQGDAFLQHGSVLLGQGQDMVARITRGPSLPLSATSLRDALHRRVAYEEVAEAIAAEARDRWVGTWVQGDGSPHVGVSDKFGDVSWTWRR